ncbi:transporter substrate-binding domain-containing protein [Georgenia halophila]|uniref:Transporter substrate-binding domain-containing protein n=1 Tax=Georgenia halophila TaxID=620889 RepID=A0ABP8KUF1_9MICO
MLAVGMVACSQTDPAGGGGDGGDGGDGGGGDGGGSGTLAEIQESGTVTLGIAGERPYSYMEDGEPTGATIAIAEEIYGQLGIDDIETQVVAWDSLIPGLNAGRFDQISAGMSILPERCEQAAFANPTIMYTTGLLVPEGNPMNLNDLQDVKESGAQLAVLTGAIEDTYAQDMGIEDTLTLQNAEDGMDAVVSGRADVFALTAISLNSMVENSDQPVEATEPFIAIVNGKEQVGAGAAVFRQGDQDLLEAWNEELDKIVGSQEKYEEVLGEFGFGEPWRPPEDITTEQLCEGELPDAEQSEAVPDEG